MGLDKETLIATLTTIFSDSSAGVTAAGKATAIGDAIDTFVKSGLVTIVGAGLSTEISVPLGGPITGIGTGSIS